MDRKIAYNLQSETSKQLAFINDVKDIEILEIDELCTYIKKSSEMVENIPSYGLLLIKDQGKLLILK